MLSVLLAYADEAKRDVTYFREAAQRFRETGDPYHEMQARHELYQALWTLNPDSARLELERFDLLKEITGETPQSYITNIRMQKARHLLDNNSPQTTILDIALSCGYEDQGAFTRAFKRFFGITPSEYLTQN